ncbi:hypothetical protein MPTK1_4g17870 [Marchantia polymorpha subsp. ruderalis]|uniref:Uncharacterized protein n=2 Tax=Marchantia polymorpha TaxID=3197 RepID=A0AAF6BB01_MARPO|nr:hypothetical protein MARPO_0041s0068 [Marchantia polymorpha]BBN09185.1 hypothetical protein Mp_4g17870 [Marchantia polymorpha subsp. ruderalis]|eukprot:PTQ40173.1 hypothetical protein MARPO_0041s0068 [Marchantia polymorpha]
MCRPIADSIHCLLEAWLFSSMGFQTKARFLHNLYHISFLSTVLYLDAFGGAKSKELVDLIPNSVCELFA